MGIGLSKIRAGLLSAVLLFSAGGCKKAYKVMPHEYVPQKALNSLDSIRKSGVEIISNPEFKLLGTDTVKLDKDFILHPEKLMEEQNKALETKYRDRYVSGSTANIWSDPDGAGMVVDYDYTSKYVDKTAVLNSNNIYTTDYLDMYVPVEHYARINPKAVPYLYRDSLNFLEQVVDHFKHY